MRQLLALRRPMVLASLPVVGVLALAAWPGCGAASSNAPGAGGAGGSASTSGGGGAGGVTASSSSTSSSSTSGATTSGSSGSGGSGGAGGGAGGSATTTTSSSSTTTSSGGGAGGGSTSSSSSGGGGAGGSGPTPTGVSLTGETDTAQRGNVGGGTAYPDACPAGQVVIGYSGLLNPSGWNGQIQATCGTPSISGGGPFTIAIAEAGTTPLRGVIGDASQTWSAMCPANQVVIGFDGRSGLLIDQIALHCAPLGVSGSSVKIGAETVLPPNGDSGGNAFATTMCAAGQVATVSNIRAGDSIDAFGLGCSTVGLTF